MPQRPTRVFTAITLALMGGFGDLLAVGGGIAARSFGARPLFSVDLPMMLIRAARPLGGALIAVFCVVRLVGVLTGRVDPASLLPESDA